MGILGETNRVNYMNAPKVAVIDDEEDILEVYKIYLGDIFDVKPFTNVPDAFDAIITQQDYSVIVTDLSLPRFNGMHLMAQLRDSQVNIPIIVATAFADKEVAMQAIRFGALSLIEKPILAQDMRMAVMRASAISQLQKNNEKLVHFCKELLEKVGDPNGINAVLNKLKPYIEGLLWQQSDLQKLNAELKNKKAS